MLHPLNMPVVYPLGAYIQMCEAGVQAEMPQPFSHVLISMKDSLDLI